MRKLGRPTDQRRAMLRGMVTYLFENGKISHPIKEMNMTGNIVSLWNSVTNIGTDYRECSRWRIPSISFENVDLSGI